MNYETLSTGQVTSIGSNGMQRDTGDKPRYDLIIPLDCNNQGQNEVELLTLLGLETDGFDRQHLSLFLDWWHDLDTAERLFASMCVREGPLLERFAELLGRGAKKYDARNWEKANGPEELDRFRQSAFRHFVQWLRGDTDEDHAAAVIFNVRGHDWLQDKIATQTLAVIPQEMLDDSPVDDRPFDGWTTVGYTDDGVTLSFALPGQEPSPEPLYWKFGHDWIPCAGHRCSDHDSPSIGCFYNKEGHRVRSTPR